MVVLTIQLLGGLIYLLVGADLLVRGSVALARRARIPPVVVALTVVALGTSLPELVVALQATLSHYPGIVLGNAVGSNVANVFIVGGLAAVIYPLTCGEGSVRRDAVIMIGASLLFIALAAGGRLTRTDGVILLSGLALTLTLTAREAISRREHNGGTPLEWVLGLPTRLGWIGLFVVLGLAGLPLGARLVVNSAVEIASRLGMTDTLVGLTIIAFSTSLPELATTVVAAMQKRTGVAIGTIVGSNIFNLLAIMGIAAVISTTPIAVPIHFFAQDFPIMLAAALVVAAFVWLQRPIGRITGVVLTLAYVVYMLLLFIR